MKEENDDLDWATLIRLQAAVELIPGSLRKHAKRLNAQARETLFRVGDPVRHIYLVLSGEVRLIRISRNGGEAILQRSRGGFIAEASLDSRCYHCDGITAEPSVMLFFPVVAFLNALEDEPDFRKAWQSQLAKEVRMLRAQCERLSFKTAAERIAHYIEAEGTNGIATLSQSRKSWAAELGLTHEALYRALRRMQADGILKVNGCRLETMP